MPRITLTDGSEKQFDQPVTALDVAESISPGLARVALAAKLNDQLIDLSHTIDTDASLTIITDRDQEGLDVLRHSAAHLLAQAVKQLHPTAQVTIGPVIENGFYYDFSVEKNFTPEDLLTIENKMLELAKADYPVTKRELSRDEAIKLFSDMGEQYKVEIIKAIPETETLTAYQQGDFIDLCRGPHIAHTAQLKAFKLTKLAGAYWRGDSNNEMLQRVYGTAWPDKKALKAYLTRIEEAEKRDHRKIAQKMHLFHMQPEAPGMAFWHPNGWTLVRLLRDYLRDVQHQYGYQEVNTPQLVDLDLWHRSGHMAKFSEEMFLLSVENRDYAVKPMNCPCHVQVFNHQGVVSYRDLPIRLAEFGSCHRNEPSGSLHGLMRARNFVQDDGHIFCTPEQIHSEVLAFIDQLHKIYADFGFTDVIHKLSTRPEKRVGSDEVWDKAEQALSEALDATGVTWDLLPGEGAFYGPKIEFSLKDCLGRVWQCGTIQVDFSMPERLDAHYIDEKNNKCTPVMLHRAALGSIERFIGILLEETAGHLPLWLAPKQVVLMSITDRQHEYIENVTKKLQNRGFRAVMDLRNEKIGFKIREHTIARVPYQIVVGDRELEQATLSVKRMGSDQSSSMTVDELIALLTDEVDSKSLNNSGGTEH